MWLFVFVTSSNRRLFCAVVQLPAICYEITHGGHAVETDATTRGYSIPDATFPLITPGRGLKGEARKARAGTFVYLGSAVALRLAFSHRVLGRGRESRLVCTTPTPAFVFSLAYLRMNISDDLFCDTCTASIVQSDHVGELKWLVVQAGFKTRLSAARKSSQVVDCLINGLRSVIHAHT